MSSTLPGAAIEETARVTPVVNDFTIQVATVNGSGSQTANLVLLRSIFQMGVPVSGKNLFPSNIAGLPTWFSIRANHRGYVSRKREVDFLVAMNAETAREDVLSLEPGRAVVYDEPLNLKSLRDDLIFYPVPFDKIVAGVCTVPGEGVFFVGREGLHPRLGSGEAFPGLVPIALLEKTHGAEETAGGMNAGDVGLAQRSREAGCGC